MTRTYTAKRLLEHGPLTFRQLLEITGWKRHEIEKTIYAMVDEGELIRFKQLGTRRNLYAVAL
jgi:hypothetical protein